MSKNEDREIIKRAQSGNATAFEALANQYYETMFRMAYKFCGNRPDAEDITQESCIRLARGIHSFKGDSAFTSWLYRLVINTGKDWYKSNNRHPKSDEGLETAQISAKGEDQLYAKQVIAAVYELPEGERDALVLCQVVRGAERVCAAENVAKAASAADIASMVLARVAKGGRRAA